MVFISGVMVLLGVFRLKFLMVGFLRIDLVVMCWGFIEFIIFVLREV